MGESLLPGYWSINRNNLVLSLNNNGITYNYIFKINYQSNETKLKGKTKPFKSMKLNRSK